MFLRATLICKSFLRVRSQKLCFCKLSTHRPPVKFVQTFRRRPSSVLQSFEIFFKKFLWDRWFKSWWTFKKFSIVHILSRCYESFLKEKFLERAPAPARFSTGQISQPIPNPFVAMTSNTKLIPNFTWQEKFCEQKFPATSLCAQQLWILTGCQAVYPTPVRQIKSMYHLSGTFLTRNFLARKFLVPKDSLREHCMLARFIFRTLIWRTRHKKYICSGGGFVSEPFTLWDHPSPAKCTISNYTLFLKVVSTCT